MSSAPATPANGNETKLLADAAPQTHSPLPDKLTILCLLGDAVRLRVVELMASGAAVTAPQLAVATRHKLNGVGKHLHLLLQAGLIQSRPAADRRVIECYIPAKFRPEPGKLVFGSVQLQV